MGLFTLAASLMTPINEFFSVPIDIETFAGDLFLFTFKGGGRKM